MMYLMAIIRCFEEKDNSFSERECGKYVQKSGGKDSVAFLGKMNAVISQGNVPVSSVGKVDTKSLGQCGTVLGKGTGVVNESLVWHPFSQGHGRRGDEQHLFRKKRHFMKKTFQVFRCHLWAEALKQVVGAQHENQ